MPQSARVTLAPAARVRGRLRVPGDKSISHRYAILAALADGRSRFDNFAPGADCRSTLSCLQKLGVGVSFGTQGVVEVEGLGVGRLHAPTETLDAGNSGTSLRLLMGVAAGYPFPTRFVGDDSLSRRPMRRVIEPIEQMGARVEAVDGHAPLTVNGARLRGIRFQTNVPSAQVKSAVLLAGLHAEGTTSVTEPAATRDHTERALETFGGHVSRDGLTVSVTGGQRLSGRVLTVPGDFSSAAFWMVAAAALPGSSIEIDEVGLNPSRTGLIEVLRRFGARIDVTVAETNGAEPRGTIHVAHDRAGAVTIAPAEVPGLIDELPAIAALAAHGGEVTVTGAAELRVKESDRISALVSGFRALGIAADERPDGFRVGGRDSRAVRPAGGRANAQGDHRMAMAFAIAALAGASPSTIDGADSVVISYPGFFEALERLVA